MLLSRLKTIKIWYLKKRFNRAIVNLSDPHYEGTRKSGAKYLGNTGNPEAIEPLLEALEADQAKGISITILESLKKLGVGNDPRIIGLLILKATSDLRYRNREIFFDALEKFGKPIQDNEMNDKWSSPGRKICLSAAKYINDSANEKIMEPFIKALDAEYINQIQRAFFEVLKELGKSRRDIRVLNLLRTCKTLDGEIGYLAKTTWDEIKNIEIKDLNDVEKKSEKEWILARKSETAGDELLKTTIAHEDPDGHYYDARVNAAKKLKEIGKPSIPKLIELLKILGSERHLGTSLGTSGSSHVLDIVCDLLVEIGNKKTIKILESMEVENYSVQEGIREVIRKLRNSH